MELIREHLVYKDVPITICMKNLTPREQYECVRLLLATRTKDVSICVHESVNSHIEKLLKELSVKFIQCWVKDLEILKFDQLTEGSGGAEDSAANSGTGSSGGGDGSGMGSGPSS